MKSLKELVSIQDIMGMSDIEVIYNWFVENEKELDGITLMEKLSRIKAEKLSNELGRIKGNLSMYSGTSTLYKAFGKKIGGSEPHNYSLYFRV